MGCIKEKVKICAHIILKCINYGKSYITNSFYHILKYQINIKAIKKKKTMKKEKKKIQAKNISNEPEEKRRKPSL